MEETPSTQELAVGPRVTTLIVTRNCADALSRSLTALAKSANPETLETVVVDMGSRDGSGTLDAEFPSIQLLRLPKYFGSTKALNIGIRTAKGEFVLLLPPGIEVMPDTIGRLLARLESDSDAAAVCTGVDQTYALPSSDALKEFWRTGRFPGAQPIDPSAESVTVEFPYGAAMLIRRGFLAGMNYFDAKYGNFGPELDLCYRIRTGGKKILAWPGVRVAGKSALQPVESPLHAADRVNGAAVYLGKALGMGAAIGFRLGAIFGALGHGELKTFFGLVSGQKIDGTQE
jgi:N-acetylglucosaminyl-diphospho-decaprenol L-rhamnosyltransferase